VWLEAKLLDPLKDVVDFGGSGIGTKNDNHGSSVVSG
jgi:hypothetical protein